MCARRNEASQKGNDELNSLLITYPCLSSGSSTSTRSADIRAALISSGKPRLRPPGFFGANCATAFPPLVPAAFPPASRFRVILGRARPPPAMSHPTVRRGVSPVNSDDISTSEYIEKYAGNLSFYDSLINCYTSEIN